MAAASGKTIALGADHGGFALKQYLAEYLAAKGYAVLDLGAYSEDAGDDYPDFAAAAARAVKERFADFAVLACRTGTGMCMAANRVKGVRAALLYSRAAASRAREHQDANVAVLADDSFSRRANAGFLDAFLRAKFSAAPRHKRRIKKLDE